MSGLESAYNLHQLKRKNEVRSETAATFSTCCDEVSGRSRSGTISRRHDKEATACKTVNLRKRERNGEPRPAPLYCSPILDPFQALCDSMLPSSPDALLVSNCSRCTAHTHTLFACPPVERAPVSDSRLFTPFHFAGAAIISENHLMRASCASRRYEG